MGPTCCSYSLCSTYLLKYCLMVVLIIQFISYSSSTLSNNESNTNIDISDQNIVYQSSTPKFEIIFEHYNSTTLKISWPAMDPEARLNNRDVSKSFLDINYYLAYAEILNDPTGSRACKTLVTLTHDHEGHDYFLGQCKQSVSYFSQSDDKEDSDHDSFAHYCDSYTKRHPLTGNSSMSLLISDLLPGQPYYFNATLHGPRKNLLSNQYNTSDVLSGPLEDSTCMPDDVPRFVPQTDLGSFVVLNRDKKQPHHLDIELYWRPVPRILESGPNMKYELKCMDEFNQVVSNQIFEDRWSGRANLTKPSNVSYTCKLWSRNSLGVSNNFSRIIIPKAQQLINFQENPKFYVATLSTNEYILNWSPQLNQENQTLSIGSREDYQYTVYWCNPSHGHSGCSNIEGMLRTKKNIYYLKMPSMVPHLRTFGVSYRSSRLYSGIIWSDCIATSQRHTSNEPLKIVEAIGVEGNHSALKVSWMFGGCNSMTALVTSFELAICDLGQVNPCFIPAPNSIPNDDTQKHDYSNCPIHKVSKMLTNEAVLNELSPSTKYLIRIRYTLQNQTYNPWSEGVIAYTYADTRNCWQQSILFHVSIFIGTTLLLSLIYCATYRYVRHCLDVINLYRQSHKELPERLKCKIMDEDGFDGSASRFSANKCASPLPGLIAGSLGDIDRLSKRSVRNNKVSENYVRYQASILDYIPCQLLVDDRNDQTISDSNHGSPNDDIHCALTAGDEISLTSQSSFLETILDHNIGEPHSQC